MKRKDFKFLSRRRFLRGTGVALVGLPLLESVREGPASAATGAPPPRFINVHCSSGVNTDRFWPSLGRLEPTSFAGTGMEAVADYASRMVIPRGVHGYPIGTWSGHLEGTTQALTAAPMANELAQGISIDQLIARHVQGTQAFVLKPGGRDHGVPAFNSISYTAPGVLASAESSPDRAYRSMMGLGGGGGGATDDPLALKRRSVLDLVRGEFEELRTLDFSAEDRLKLEQHFALIRDVEVMVGSPEVVACELADVHLGELGMISADDVEVNANFPLATRLMVRIAALAVACGYSSSVVIQLGAAVAGSPMYRWDGIQHDYRHHPLSHGTTGDNDGDEVLGWQDMIFDIDRWNMAEFRQLLDLLDGYAEAEGRSLLDNTVVFYSNEFSHGQGHTTGDLPLAVFGGAGRFRLGESLVVQGSSADIAGTTDPGNSNRLLRTILDSLEVPPEGFSDGPSSAFEELLV